jgi:hypothetical protein
MFFCYINNANLKEGRRGKNIEQGARKEEEEGILNKEQGKMKKKEY